MADPACRLGFRVWLRDQAQVGDFARNIEAAEWARGASLPKLVPLFTFCAKHGGELLLAACDLAVAEWRLTMLRAGHARLAPAIATPTPEIRPLAANGGERCRARSPSRAETSAANSSVPVL